MTRHPACTRGLMVLLAGSASGLLMAQTSATEGAVKDTPAAAATLSAATLSTVTVTDTAPGNESRSLPGRLRLEGAALTPRRLGSSDAAELLQGLPGLSLYGAGGVSSLPVIHGLADERLRIQVDGMDLMAACPNHMNSPLSYIDASNVARVRVFAGITPVSVGGDSLGGTVQVESAAPKFAAAGQGVLTEGHVGSFYRSNGRGRGADAALVVANEGMSLSYTGASAQSDNYHAAAPFKAAAATSGGALAGDEVGSSAYRARNQSLGLALRHDTHWLQLSASQQDIPFEGYPNQRMDMTGNRNTQLNARYQGQYEWGELLAQAYSQRTHHRMDMGADRDSYGTGMPMNTEARTLGASLKAHINWTERDLLRLGLEAQHHSLNDWWPPVGGTMGPNAFWNLNYGRRQRHDAFAEWEAQWQPQWSSLLGLRLSSVTTDAASAQGYNNNLASLWGNDAASFNAQGHRRTDLNWDLTALVRHTPAAGQSYELGYARKSRAPSLYQRYPWSTQAMAALMNNFAGDGNGYIGNQNLRPEVAHTLSATADWQAVPPPGAAPGSQPDWQVRGTVYLTQIENYIDAQRCAIGQCAAANQTDTHSFVLLQYQNQQARLQGLDLSGQALLGRTARLGTLQTRAVLNWVQGTNRVTGDGLYNQMPLNLRWSLEQQQGAWSQSLEWLAVSAKTRVSQVRNEMPTQGYALMNWRASYQFQQARFDFGIDNLFNRFYSAPLGGAYLGQGSSMAINGIAWGVPVPGKGRSIQLALRLDF